MEHKYEYVYPPSNKSDSDSESEAGATEHLRFINHKLDEQKYIPRWIPSQNPPDSYK